MEPLVHAPSERLAGISGVLFDVDDTLTTGGRVGAQAFSALHQLSDAGLRLAAVTGRPLGWSDAMAALWPIELAVGENGAGWSWRERGAMRMGYFEREGAAHAADARRALVERVAAELPGVSLAADQPARRCDLAFDIGEASPQPATVVSALVSLIESAGARAVVSSVHAHAMFGGWNKADGAQRAMRDARLDDDVEAWLFVGDSGNDADAFARFPHSVGVANVREHLERLPTPPRWVTAGARGAGFCELAERILGARR